jgi:phosphohistidine phosphatase
MNRLYLLRHAKAAPEADGQADRDRPLAEKGERAMREIGAWAAERKLVPDLILCSAALRTRQTLALLLPHLSGRPEVKLEDGLYLASAAVLTERLRKLGPRTAVVLVIGHNPGLHDLALRLARSTAGALGKRLKEGLPTGALAAFELDDPWPALADAAAARLVAYVTPKELRE